MKHPVFTIDQIWHVEIGTEIMRFESYSEAFKAYAEINQGIAANDAEIK